MGLDPRQFVDPVDDKYVCKLCHKVFLDPVANHCGHIFCSSCVKKRLGGDMAKRCPDCSAQLIKKMSPPSMDFRLELLTLQIRCHNKCGKTFPLSSLPDHMGDECPNTAMTCPNISKGCKKKIRRCDIKKHVEECDFRDVECEACGFVTIYCNLFTHQSRVRCLEKKLKQQIIREQRNHANDVKRHRAHLTKQNIRREVEDRRVVLEHTRYLKNGKNKMHGSLESLTNNKTSDVFLTEVVNNQPNGDEGTSPPPHPSRTGHAVFSCIRCKKLYNAMSNNEKACRWHAGPIMDVFGGTCFACGRVDYQPGCMSGHHHS